MEMLLLAGNKVFSSMVYCSCVGPVRRLSVSQIKIELFDAAQISFKLSRALPLRRAYRKPRARG
jgi:hypothetical protein